MDVCLSLACILGLEPTCWRKIPIDALLRLGLEFFQITRSAALRDRTGSRQKRKDDDGRCISQKDSGINVAHRNLH